MLCRVALGNQTVLAIALGTQIVEQRIIEELRRIELILCSTIFVSSVTRHNIHMYNTGRWRARKHFVREIHNLFHIHLYVDRMGVSETSYLQVPEHFRMDVTKTANGKWEIENGKLIVLFWTIFCAKIREKRSVLRAWCLLVFSESDQTPHRGPDFCFYIFSNSLVFFLILS